MKKLLFVLMLLGCASVVTTTHAATLYWTNNVQGGAYTNANSWDTFTAPTGADTVIFTNVDISGVRSQWVSVAGANNYAQNLYLYGGSSAAAAFTNKFSAAATGAKLHVYDTMRIGWQDGANVYFDPTVVNGNLSIFVTNALGTAAVWVGVTNNNGAAKLAYRTITVDNLYTTNNATILGSTSGDMTIKHASAVTSAGNSLSKLTLQALPGGGSDNGTHNWNMTSEVNLSTLVLSNGVTFNLVGDFRNTAGAAITNATFNYNGKYRSDSGGNSSLANSSFNLYSSTMTNGGATVFYQFGSRTAAANPSYGTNNVLNVVNSTLRTKDLTIVQITSAFGNTNSVMSDNRMIVDNSYWTNSGNVVIVDNLSTTANGTDRYTSNNVITVQNGSQVQVGGNVWIGATNNFGTALSGIGGNALTVTGSTTRMTVDGKVDVRYGALNLNDGQLTVSSLFATNGAANSALNIRGGTLSVTNLSVNNGAAQVIGDGDAAIKATLNLLNGGSSKFANGLVLTNDAILNIGSSPGTANVEGDVNLKAGSKWAIDWTTLTSGDLLNVTGNVFLTGAQLEVNLGSSFAVGSIWTNLVAFSGGTITTNGLTLSTIGTPLTEGALAFKLNDTATVGYLEVIPEPSALTLLGLGMGLAMLVVRRRRS